MKTDLIELQKELDKTAKKVNELGKSYETLVKDYKQNKKELSKADREERETPLAQASSLCAE